MSIERSARLEAVLRESLQPTDLQIRDDSAAHAGHAGARDGSHFHVRIAAASFAGLSRLERHRLVYAAAAALLKSDIHALSIDARLPS